MTSEIILFNKQAISTASDSNITIDDIKTASGFKKQFPLNDELGMAIVIYENVDYDGIPMETLIGEFNEKTDFSKINTVKDVHDAFINFLEHETNPFDVKEYIEEYLEYFKEEFENDIKNITEKEFNILMEYYSQIDVFPFVKLLKEYNQYDNEFKKIIPEFGHDNFELNWKTLKKYFFGTLFDNINGFAITGFNRYDKFPSYINSEISINNNGKIEIVKSEFKYNCEENKIIVLAQYDVIENILNGIHEDQEAILLENYHNHKNIIYQNILNELSKQNIPERYLTKFKNAIKKSIESIDKDMESFEEIISYMKTDFSKPTLNSLDTISKKDLAKMAKLLIEITSLKRKVSPDLNSVGGEIHVSLITKADKFNWIS